VPMEGGPRATDLDRLRAHLLDQVEGVAHGQDVHVWSRPSGRVLATLELGLDAGTDPRQVVPAVKQALAERFGIGHTTVEVPFDPPQACALRAAAGPEREG